MLKDALQLYDCEKEGRGIDEIRECDSESLMWDWVGFEPDKESDEAQLQAWATSHRQVPPVRFRWIEEKIAAV